MNDVRRSFGRALMRAKALGRAASMLSVLVVLAIWASSQDFSPVVTTERAQAVVVEVKEAGWQVRLENGETSWISPSPGIQVSAGEVVPVLIETQESGTRRAYFDRERWIGGG